MSSIIRYILFFQCFLIGYSALGQVEVSGTVRDLLTDEPLSGVKITEEGGNAVTYSDDNGQYVLEISSGGITVKFSKSTYLSEYIQITNTSSPLNVSLILDTDFLKEVVLVGSRFKPRSIADSPEPIDNISQEELRSAGHHDLDMMMMYNIPSFNSSIQTVSDATAHMNPAELRGLGPSRTLVLVNGKRKNYSSLVYINDTPGKGEVGTDLTTIPIAAIERVEVLRNGASAQYGSDAIAGVVNIVLKENQQYAEINTISGINQEGDGLIMGFDAHIGTPINDRGFVSISTNFKRQEETNRAGVPGRDAFFGGIIGDAAVSNGTNSWIQSNPDLDMVVGQPAMTTNNLLINTHYDLSQKATIYAFGNTSYRNGTSFALYRPAYLVNDYGLFNGNGFLPDFQTDIHDVSLTLGMRGQSNGWDYDVSTTRGKHSIGYIIGNTLNDSLGVTSPTRFDAGGYTFSQVVNNLDISRSFDNFDIGLGFEFRNENFIAEAGEPNSYLGEGSISFPGIQPSNEVNEHRNNLGVYFDLSSQLSDKLLLGGAVRYENYSDFGSRFNWMLQGKFDLIPDRLMTRASVSTGFRAPSLHQIHLSNVQTILSGGTISNQGTFKNSSTVLRRFDIPELEEETSVNYSLGLTVQPSDRLLITADYFHIDVHDRIVFTGAIGDDGNSGTTTQTESILQDFNITSFKFFTNAINTHTDGVDLVVSYDDIPLSRGKLKLSLTGNYTKTRIKGDLRTSEILESEGNSLFDRKEQSRITSARPNSKVIFKSEYRLNKLKIGVNNTYFGDVTWQHAVDVTKDQTFTGKTITDLDISYQLMKGLEITIGANNLFDVYPDELDDKGDPETSLGGRFKYAWEVNQFGFNGRFIFGKLKVTL